MMVRWTATTSSSTWPNGTGTAAELGLAEIDRLRAEYAELGERLSGCTEQAEIFERLHNDSGLYYTDGDQIMADARKALAAAESAMPDW
jgi:uncharacterized protein (DUF885 family)